MNIEVLDKGFVEVIDSLGSDLTVVNSARVSFGKRKTTYSDGDRKLVRFLAKNKHYSPFRHMMVQFHIKAPEFVMRQWYKHVVGIETTNSSATKDHAWNEISGRYVPVKDFYMPENWRKQSEDNKQASEGVLSDVAAKDCSNIFEDFMNNAQNAYNNLLDKGVAKEQARMILPQSMKTEWYWSGTLMAFARVCNLRCKPDAQLETRLITDQIDEISSAEFPVSWKALRK